MKFKLKDQTEDQNLDKVQFHARALRAIGQDLSGLFPEHVEISLLGKDFHVVGRYVPRTKGSKASPQGGVFAERVWKGVFHGQRSVQANEIAVEPVNFDRTYTQDEIKHLDEIGASQRKGTAKTPDIYSLSEMLRMVGRIIDAAGGRLVRLSRDTRRVTVEYHDGNDVLQKSEMSSLELYKLQQQYYAERGTFVPIDTWDGRG
jgi:hypothetical protein